MKVSYIDHMGTDLTVANAARVSFDKETGFDDDGNLKSKDVKLINYLADHGHWSPFAHCMLQLRIDAPIFIARQLVKHQVGLTWNEVSRRYVEYEPSFYLPDELRERSKSNKQGSAGALADSKQLRLLMEKTCSDALDSYNILLREGVAPEMARIILPQNMMTSWYWTGSLYAFARVVKQRLHPDAQKEAGEVAKGISEIAREYFPVAWSKLIDG